MIELKNVVKKFGSEVVLSGLSFSVPDGESVALLGLSGSGKTTALKLVCGLHLPDSGSVQVQGIAVTPSRLQELRRNFGYVIQDGGLFPHLTAEENIRLVADQAGWSDAQTHARMEELAALTHMPTALLTRYPRQLSGGQRQRVGAMRALMLDPPILLLDEPMGALDPITRSEMQDELRALFRDLRKTVLLVTHDLFEAGYLAERILLLDHGKIAQEGSMDELLRNPANDFVRQFIRAQRRVGDGQ